MVDSALDADASTQSVPLGMLALTMGAVWLIAFALMTIQGDHERPGSIGDGPRA